MGQFNQNGDVQSEPQNSDVSSEWPQNGDVQVSGRFLRKHLLPFIVV